MRALRAVPPARDQLARARSVAPSTPISERIAIVRMGVARVATVARDVLPLLVLAVAVVGVPVLVLEPQGLPRLRSLEHDVAEVEAENRAVERDIARLRNEVKLLKDDLGTVEQVARRDLGLVRKSEIVFQLPPPTRN